MWAAFWRIIRALTLAVVLVVLVWCIAVGTRLSWTLAFTCIGIKHFPIVTPKFPRTLTLAGVRIEYLSWIRAFTSLIGARTLASILVKYVGCWAVFPPETFTVTCFIAEGLAIGTVLDPGASTLAIPTVEPVRSLTCSIMITLALA